MLFQYVLELGGPFEDSVMEMESAYYQENLNTYGVPLDNVRPSERGRMRCDAMRCDAARTPHHTSPHTSPRHTIHQRADFTKLDWSMWVAAMGTDDQFDAITSSTWAFADSTTDRVPLSDWTYTRLSPSKTLQHTSQHIGMAHPPMSFQLPTLAATCCEPTAIYSPSSRPPPPPPRRRLLHTPCSTPTMAGFQARPVMGGIYAKLLMP